MARRTILTSVLSILVLAACSGDGSQTRVPITRDAPQDAPTPEITDPVLRAGQAAYRLRCAHCHGQNGEGQLASTVPNTLNLGMHTVPAHDSSGHTWQHPDQLLIRVIREGIQNPLDQYMMPAFGSDLSDAEIAGLLAYIKLWWSDEQRETQAQRTQNWAATERELGISDD